MVAHIAMNLPVEGHAHLKGGDLDGRPNLALLHLSESAV
jgi:hypothetical protein